MKKFLLTLATIAAITGSSNAMYVIGDQTGKWDTGRGFEMEETEDGWQWTGYIGYFKFFGFATELKPGMDWMTFNQNYRLSPVKDAVPADNGNYPLHFGSPEASFMGLGKVCTLKLTKDDFDVYSLNIENVEESDDTWGVIGDFNHWGEDVEMEQINPNVWATTIPSMDGNFKFRANGDWSMQYGADKSFTISGNGQYPVSLSEKPFNIEKSNNVALILDLNSKTLTTKDNSAYVTPLALRGDMNEWEWNGKYCLTVIPETGVCTINLPSIQADTKFTIANLDWSEQLSSQVMNMSFWQIYDLQQVYYGGEMGCSSDYDGEVTVRVYLHERKISIYPSTNDVNEISVPEGKTSYFNLQGVKVENPKNGIFIRVSNGKTEKVIMK